MQITFEQAARLPVFYSIAYREGSAKRQNLYFTDRDEAVAEENRLIAEGTRYKLCIPCNRQCDTCGICN